MPKYTRRHYRDIAKILRYRKSNDTTKRINFSEFVVDDLVSLFSFDNPKFKKQTFMDAIFGKIK